MLILIPPVALSGDTYWSFTSSRGADSSNSGIYWTQSTDEVTGEYTVTAVVINVEGNVKEKAKFDADGNMTSGVNTDESESFADYLADSMGESSGGTENGFWGQSDPYNCDFNCNPNGGFGTPEDTFGGG